MPTSLSVRLTLETCFHHFLCLLVALWLVAWPVEALVHGNAGGVWMQVLFDLVPGALLLALPLLLVPLKRWLPVGLVLLVVGLLQLLPFFYLVAAALFFDQTGSVLTFEVVAYALRHLDHLHGLLVGSLNIVGLLLLPAPLLLVAAGWWVALSWGEMLRQVPGLRLRNALMVVLAGLLLVGTRARAADEYPGMLLGLLAAAGQAWTGKTGGVDAATTKFLASLEVATPGVAFRKATVSGELKQPRDVIVLVLESFRADMIHARDANGQEMTPVLNRLHEQDFVYYERAYTTINHTSKALVGILCGRYARLGMNFDDAMPGWLPDDCLASLLAQQGYHTAFIQSADGGFEDRAQLVQNMGYARFVQGQDLAPGEEGVVGYFAYDDHLLVPVARQLLQETKSPLFLTVLNVLTHHPYCHPTFGCPDYGDPIQGYRRVVPYVDEYVGKMLAMLRAEGRYDDALIVITADHGEAFSEHGRWVHDDTPYEEVVHVPLWVKLPGQGSGVSSRLSQHTDLVPTLLQALGLRLDGDLPGSSLLDGTRERAVTFCWYGRCRAMVNAAGQKHVLELDEMGWSYHDLDTDPLEQAPLDSGVVTIPPPAHLLPVFEQEARINAYWNAFQATLPSPP